MSDRTKKVLPIVIIAFAVVMGIVGMLVLPQTLAVQIGTGGTVSNTLPKPVGLLIPFAICVIFSVLFRVNGEMKSLFGALVGVLAFLLMFAFNL